MWSTRVLQRLCATLIRVSLSKRKAASPRVGKGSAAVPNSAGPRGMTHGPAGAQQPSAASTPKQLEAQPGRHVSHSCSQQHQSREPGVDVTPVSATVDWLSRMRLSAHATWLGLQEDGILPLAARGRLGHQLSAVSQTRQTRQRGHLEEEPVQTGQAARPREGAAAGGTARPGSAVGSSERPRCGTLRFTLCVF